MANRLISQLAAILTGNLDATDLVEVQEDDQSVTKKVTITVLNELEAAARAAQDDVIEAAVGTNADGTYDQPAGSHYLDATTDVMDALDALDTAISGSGSGIYVIQVPVNSANLNNAGIAPYELIVAPGALYYIEVLHASIFLNNHGTDIECGTQKLIIEYDTGASHFVEWSNAFIEGSADTASKGTWTSNVTMIANKKVQLTFDGAANPTAGDTSLYVWLTYIIRDSAVV